MRFVRRVLKVLLAKGVLRARMGLPKKVALLEVSGRLEMALPVNDLPVNSDLIAHETVNDAQVLTVRRMADDRKVALRVQDRDVDKVRARNDLSNMP